MADKKISQLTGATTPVAGTETLPIVQGGSTKQVSIDNLTKGRSVNASAFDTDVAAAGVTLSGTTLAADGTDADIDINLAPKGTGEVNITKVDIDGGAIDGTTVGANAASTGKFTQIDVDNIRVDGNVVSTTNANGNVEVTPDGTGRLQINHTPAAAGTQSNIVINNVYPNNNGGNFNRISWQNSFYGTEVALEAGKINAGSGASQLSIYTNEGAALRERLRVTPVGDIDMNLTYGGNIKFASGKGIDFSATGQATGMTSELLDDYEIGTWTPVATNLTVSGTPNYNGRYVKIGNLVFITFTIAASTSTDSTADNTYFTGLPFTVAAASSITAVGNWNVSSIGIGLIDGSTRVYTPTWSSGANQTVTLSGVYRTT
jgi:hypothetical protein